MALYVEKVTVIEMASYKYWYQTNRRTQCQASEHAQDEAANVQIDNSWQ